MNNKIYGNIGIIDIFLLLSSLAIVGYVIYQIVESARNNEHMINIPTIEPDNLGWNRSKSCKHYMDDTTTRVLNELKVKEKQNHKKATMIFPCGYNNINDEIKTLPNVQNKDTDTKRVFIIEGADEITAKNYLWKNIYNHHGFRKALSLSPNTYLLTGPQRNIDITRLKKEHYPGRLYIMKKNVQRQTGIHVTDNIDEILNSREGYVLVQEMLQNSYLVNGRKINLRVYILVICHKNNTDVYMFNNGFMYYTKQKYVKGLKDKDNHITTGYVARDVYHKNPLTHDDFKRYLDMNAGEKYHDTNDPRNLYPNEIAIRSQGLKVSDVVFDRMQKMMADVFISFKGNICKRFAENGELHIYNDYSVQIFGADVAIDDQLQPQIIEINKGPDLSPKDDRDGNVKRKMFKDVLERIGIKQLTEDNGLKLVLEM